MGRRSDGRGGEGTEGSTARVRVEGGGMGWDARRVGVVGMRFFRGGERGFGGLFLGVGMRCENRWNGSYLFTTNYAHPPRNVPRPDKTTKQTIPA